MKDVIITAVKQTEYKDLIAQFENPIENACDVNVGDVFVCRNGQKPDGLCQSAWDSIKEFVVQLANGGGNFFCGWMKNPHSAMISCNDGFRPMSFYIQTKEEN